MGGRRRVAGGFTPWLPDDRGPDGRAFRRHVGAALEVVGPLNGPERVRVEVWRYAIAGDAFEVAARAWRAVVAQRERGKGRRPSTRQVERAARRLGLAEQTLAAARARVAGATVSALGRGRRRRLAHHPGAVRLGRAPRRPPTRGLHLPPADDPPAAGSARAPAVAGRGWRKPGSSSPPRSSLGWRPPSGGRRWRPAGSAAPLLAAIRPTYRATSGG
jgi:hypothetical protein